MVLIVALLVCLLSRKERGTPHMFIVDVVSRFGCRARSSRGAIVRLGCGAIGQAGSWSCRRAGSWSNGQAKSGPGTSVGQLLTREERAHTHTRSQLLGLHAFFPLYDPLGKLNQLKTT